MPNPTLNEITRAASMVYGLHYEQLMQRNRSNRYARARWAAMYVARVDTCKSMPMIGRHFFNMDHTSVLHGVRRLSKLMMADPAILASVASVRAVAAKLAEVRADTIRGHVTRLHAECRAAE